MLPPSALFLDPETLHGKLKDFRRLALTAGQPHPDFRAAPDVSVARRAEDPVAKLRALVQGRQNRLLLCADSAGRRETLVQMLNEFGVTPDAQPDSIEAFLSSDGIASPRAVRGLPARRRPGPTENDLYPGLATTGRRGKRDQERASNVEAMVRDLSELRAGDPVVHAQHGIGRYHGLVNMDMGEGEMEFLHLEYANGSTLYVPVSQLHVIARYSGADPEAAPLHQLGSGQWDKARRKAAKQVRDTAAELLALYAQRAAREGYAFKLPLNDYEAFAEASAETADQAAAIQAVIADMTSGRPMDRLVCGDVGFGKTEVALRAAFLAVANGKQVALLCPTTLLAEQHAQTFADRFADWPVRVVGCRASARPRKSPRPSRASTTAAWTSSSAPTRSCPGREVQAPGPGHHRRGTPLRRAPEGSAEGAARRGRCADADRHADSAHAGHVAGRHPRFLRDRHRAAEAPGHQDLRAARGRQHAARGALARTQARRPVLLPAQRGRDHPQPRARLEELVPEARIAVAHGQMAERELEQVMKGFYQQRYNVLLCTTIIETGIDVPSANTIVIHRADRFGLAQLHQLRGRVGRSHHQAYAYLLTPGEDAITSNAKKRLEAIQAMEELGSGFYLAMHDLEIRGTGEVLGDSQSGNIQEVGFSMYNEMLNEAVRAASGRGTRPDAPFNLACEVNLRARPAALGLLRRRACAPGHLQAPGARGR